jgi:CBS domain-containing protein
MRIQDIMSRPVYTVQATDTIEYAAALLADRKITAAPVVAVPAGADLADVAELLLRHDVRSVPVLDDEQVVGVVSRRDILRTVVRTDDVLAFQAQHRLDEYADGARRWSVTVADGVASIDGNFADDPERAIVTILARTVPGVTAVRIAQYTS